MPYKVVAVSSDGELSSLLEKNPYVKLDEWYTWYEHLYSTERIERQGFCVFQRLEDAQYVHDLWNQASRWDIGLFEYKIARVEVSGHLCSFWDKGIDRDKSILCECVKHWKVVEWL